MWCGSCGRIPVRLKHLASVPGHGRDKPGDDTGVREMTRSWNALKSADGTKSRLTVN